MRDISELLLIRHSRCLSMPLCTSTHKNTGVLELRGNTAAYEGDEIRFVHVPLSTLEPPGNTTTHEVDEIRLFHVPHNASPSSREATRRRGGEASEASKASEARQARKARHAASLKARDASLMACAVTRFWCLPEGGRSASTRASAPTTWPTDPMGMHRYGLLTLCGCTGGPALAYTIAY